MTPFPIFTAKIKRRKPRHHGTPTMKTYRFSTFKELMETVPADRIRACLEELGVVLSVAKATADLLIGTAVELAARDGVKISKPAIAYPDVMEWVDDGKGTLEVNLDEMKNI